MVTIRSYATLPQLIQGGHEVRLHVVGTQSIKDNEQMSISSRIVFSISTGTDPTTARRHPSGQQEETTNKNRHQCPHGRAPPVHLALHEADETTDQHDGKRQDGTNGEKERGEGGRYLGHP